MRRVNIGMIGCGVISHTYISNIKAFFPWLNLLACSDVNMDKARAAAMKYGIPKPCSVEDLLKDPEIEIVVNLTLPAAHAMVNQSILRAGKHVYCEKPFALNMEEAEETVRLAKERGLMIGCAPETFLGAGLQTCRKVIDEGWIGKPVAASGNMMSSGTETWHASPEFYYKKGAGPMLDMGSYYLSALVFLLGPIQSLGCFSGIGSSTRRVYSKPLRGTTIEVEVPTTYTGILEFENGALVNLNMSFDIWYSSLPKLEIYGTEGTLIVPDPNMFGGRIMISRKEKIVDRISYSMYHGNEPELPKGEEILQEIPQLYQQPLEYMRGYGLLDMAFALVNGRRHRANEELVYHVTEALLNFDTAQQEKRVYQMKSTCARPAPIPLGLEFGELD